MHNIKFTLGDPWGDGHGYHKEFHLESNYSAADITLAYEKATKRIGFDFVKECCSEWEDTTIESDKTEILIKYDIIDAKDLDDNVYHIWNSKYYVEIFIKIIKLIIPDFILQDRDIREEELIILNGAAYGIFLD